MKRRFSEGQVIGILKEREDGFYCEGAVSQIWHVERKFRQMESEVWRHGSKRWQTAREHEIENAKLTKLDTGNNLPLPSGLCFTGGMEVSL